MESIFVYLIFGGAGLLILIGLISGFTSETTKEDDELFTTMLILGMFDSPEQDHHEDHHDTCNDDDLMDTMIACDMLD